MSTCKTTRLSVLAATGAVLLAAPASALAFNPQPDPPGFGAEMSAAQTIVHNPPGLVSGAHQVAVVNGKISPRP